MLAHFPWHLIDSSTSCQCSHYLQNASKVDDQIQSNPDEENQISRIQTENKTETVEYLTKVVEKDQILAAHTHKRTEAGQKNEEE